MNATEAAHKSLEGKTIVRTRYTDRCETETVGWGQRGLVLELSDEASNHIIQKGTNLDFGARPLRRSIERMLEDPLSEELIRGELRGGDIEIYLDGGVLAYRVSGEPDTGRQLPVSVEGL